MKSKKSFIIYILLIDLVLGGAGRYLQIFGLSARMIIFILSLVYVIFKTIKSGRIKICVYNKALISFFVIIAYGTIIGIYNNVLSDVYQGLTGYLYILTIYVFYIEIDTIEKCYKYFNFFNKLAVISSMFLIVMYIMILNGVPIYGPLINSINKNGIGMVSYASNGFPRIFLKGCIFIVISAIYYVIKILSHEKSSIKDYVCLVILTISIFMTFTMGFWISFVVGLIILTLFFYKLNIKRKKLVIVSIMTIITLIFVGSEIKTVFMQRMNFEDPSFNYKYVQTLNMINLFYQKIFLGWGIGKRIETLNNFSVNQENAWMQFLVNFGSLGLMCYLYFVFNILLRTLKLFNKCVERKLYNVRDITLTFFIGIIIIVVFNFSNPMLNNPLGIGFLCFSMALTNTIENEIIGD